MSDARDVRETLSAGRAEPARRPRRATILLALVATACSHGVPPKRGRLVALVVMDTVRRDHVVPCGSPLPTTPNLAALAAESTVFCNVVAPGSWTLPVHASIFTGELPIQHGADFDAAGRAVPGAESLMVSGLRESIPTLAEAFASAGWQTALLSANPVLHPAIGLTRGFSHVWVAPRFVADDRAEVVEQVERFLDSVEPGQRPLFLVVNIIAAHLPYPRVPEGVSWLPATTRDIDLFGGVGEPLFASFQRHEMSAQAESSLIRDARYGYAWGVHRADEQLGGVLRALRSRGWIASDSVLAVTSDHGEFLGEHHMLDHGRSVDPEDIDVFAVVHGPRFRAAARDDTLVQSQDLFPTLLEAAGIPGPPRTKWLGSLSSPRADRIAATFSEPDAFWARLTQGRLGTRRLVAVQTGSARAVWSRAALSGHGQAAASVSSTGPADETRRLDRLVADLASIPRQAGPKIRPDADLQEQLRALGYVQ
jgi:arylsulfatase A-like enzyme